MDMPPIVEKVYDLNKWLLQKVGRFPCDQRFLLGERLMGKALDIQDALVAAATMARGEEKRRTLAGAALALDQLRYLLRLARDCRSMSRDSWYFCAKNVTEVGKMLGGWIKNAEE
jgi:hypothetical protein